MKRKYFISAILFTYFVISLSAQKKQNYNLHKLITSNGITIYNREFSLINEKGYPGIHLSPNYGEGLAWINGTDFSDGIIEFDVRGKNEKQHSFVGFAFHGKNDTTYDAIYLRPFQFLEENEVLRKRSIQYISLPDHTWRRLRETAPGKYENNINPSPNPNAWVHITIVIKDHTVSTYVNGSKEPSLVVDKVTASRNGSLGFYVADVSGGDFANLRVRKSK